MQLEPVPGTRFLDITPALAPAAPAVAKAAVAPAGAFPLALTQGLQALNSGQAEAGQAVSAFLSGQGPDLHTVLLTVERSSLSLEFAVQLRNKVVEAYSEIMRMQI